MSSTVSAYLIGFIVLVVCVLLAVVSAKSISYEAGVNPKDRQKRKTWFWVFAILCPIAVLAVAYFAVYTDIRVPSRQDAYLVAMGISAAVAFVLYIICGLALSKMFPNGKLASWF